MNKLGKIAIVLIVANEIRGIIFVGLILAGWWRG
jgi:hypothetical protein